MNNNFSLSPDIDRIVVNETNILPDQLQWWDQWQIKTNGGAWYVNTYWEVAQSFEPTKNILSQVSLLIMKEGHPSWEYTVIIRENLRGKDLAKVSIIPYFSGKNYSWVVFDFLDINVTAGKKYYIISRAYNRETWKLSWMALFKR